VVQGERAPLDRGARAALRPSHRCRAGGVVVRELGYRWGSCSRGDTLNFHWRAVQLPPRITEYVIVHELVHLLEPHHKPAFWKRLERAMPDYA